MNSLPLYIYTAYETHEPLALTRAFGAASVLLAMVLLLFVVARWIVRDKTGRDRSRFCSSSACSCATPVRSDGRVRRSLTFWRALQRGRCSPRSARRGSALPAGAATPLQINGSGSSWAANAINQWVQDVYTDGVQVTFNPDGDAQGRQDFANKVSDFAVTADGYQGFDSTTGVSDTSDGRAYAYLPVAAGGTSFPYQIKFDGTQVENLRLSGETLAKIFTNQITNWDDPEITKDNNGSSCPPSRSSRWSNPRVRVPPSS